MCEGGDTTGAIRIDPLGRNGVVSHPQQARRGSREGLPTSYDEPMSTMNISLPETLKTFVDEQVNLRGFGTSSEYVRELIRKDQDRQQLRSLLLAGAASAPGAAADSGYFDALRSRVRSARG